MKLSRSRAETGRKRHERPESRLAEMDSDRENRCRTYRAYHEQHNSRPTPSQSMVAAGQASPSTPFDTMDRLERSA